MDVLGCYYWEIMIPSFITLPEKSGYELSVNGRKTFVNVFKHVKTIIINDYSNNIVKNGRLLALENTTLQIGLNSFGVFDPEKDDCLYVIDFSENKRKEYTKTTYSQIMLFFESTKDADNVSLAQNAFEAFYKAYQIVSDNFFALPIEHLHSYSIVKRDFFHPYTAEELLTDESQRLKTPRAVNFALRRWDQPYIISNNYQNSLDQNAHRKYLAKYLKTEKHNDFINETLLSANRELRVYKNYKYALLECFFIIENVIFNFIENKKIAKGISRKKLKESSNRVGISYLLNIELPMLVDNYDDKIKSLITSLDAVRKVRNDVVHNGGLVKEDEAEKAVLVTVEMLNYFKIEKF
jgi:hypothetical protein